MVVVSLFMKSSFSRRPIARSNPVVTLVRGCLNNEKSEFEADFGVNIGAASSIVSWRHAYDGPATSAFPLGLFRCATGWRRGPVSPRGCGLPAMEKGHVEGNQVAGRVRRRTGYGL
jgi:hypothetical protein